MSLCPVNEGPGLRSFGKTAVAPGTDGSPNPPYTRPWTTGSSEKRPTWSSSTTVVPRPGIYWSSYWRMSRKQRRFLPFVVFSWPGSFKSARKYQERMLAPDDQLDQATIVEQTSQVPPRPPISLRSRRSGGVSENTGSVESTSLKHRARTSALG